MKNVQIQLFPNQLSTKPMRDILGMCNSPTVSHAGRGAFEKRYFDALNLGHVRYHDASIENQGHQVIDIHRIFPLFHLDENDPRNYFFGHTDDYLSIIADGRAEIDFKLGETIDLSERGLAKVGRLVGNPEDVDKWARICRNIIGHYKNGEMDGMHLNITRVTVWEEPDAVLFGGTLEEYAKMFCTVYKVLKKDFPDLKIGGPTTRCGNLDFMRKFLTICKENDVYPDYVCTTMYARDIPFMLDMLQKYRDLTVECGFPDAASSLSEWHLEPLSWEGGQEPLVYENGCYTTVNAAYSAATLTALMDVDHLDTVYYYAWGISWCAVFDKFSTTGARLLPVYYGLKFFQKLATECERIEVKADAPKGVYSLAGKTADGKTRLLVSCYEADTYTFTCNAENASKCMLYSVTGQYREMDAVIGQQLPIENGSVSFTHNGRYGVYLLEFE